MSRDNRQCPVPTCELVAGHDLEHQHSLTTGQVVTLATGVMACPIDEIYLSLNALLDDNLLTHQLPRGIRFVGPYLREACPWVETIPELELDESDREGSVRVWLERISEEHGNRHQVPHLAGQWVPFNPLDELIAMRGES